MGFSTARYSKPNLPPEAERLLPGPAGVEGRWLPTFFQQGAREVPRTRQNIWEWLGMGNWWWYFGIVMGKYTKYTGFSQTWLIKVGLVLMMMGSWMIIPLECRQKMDWTTHGIPSSAFHNRKYRVKFNQYLRGMQLPTSRICWISSMKPPPFTL